MRYRGSAGKMIVLLSELVYRAAQFNNRNQGDNKQNGTKDQQVLSIKQCQNGVRVHNCSSHGLRRAGSRSSSRYLSQICNQKFLTAPTR